LTLVVFLGGCAEAIFPTGGGGSGPLQGGINVQVTPATGAVRTGSQQAFTAKVTGTTNTTVSWSVNGIAGGNSTIGTIAASGNYTAPLTLPTTNNITVTATSVQDTTRSGNAAITLENQTPVITSVSPLTLSVGVPFAMTVNGTGFTSGSVVNLGTVALTTTYIATTQLAAIGTPTTAQVPGARRRHPSTCRLSVRIPTLP